jgi:hypothetical protein
MTSALKKIKRRKIDPMLSTLGIEIKEFSSELDHFMISSRLRKKSVDLAATAIARFLHAAGHSPDARQLEDAILAFYALAPRCPVRQSSGGCGFNAGLELFVTARLLAPSLVLESGVYRGFTTWVLRQAVPQAKMLSFDIDLSRLRRTEERVEYIEADISGYDFSSLRNEKAFCFFDDHVSQVRRIEQTEAWGFTNMVFDDNLPVHALHGDGLAPYPTIDMVFDDDFVDGELIEWKTQSRFEYKVCKADLMALREKIAFAQRFPDLSWETGYRGSNLTYVRLRSPMLYGAGRGADRIGHNLAGTL